MALNSLVDVRDAKFVLFEMLEIDKLGEKYPQYADYDKDTMVSTYDLAEQIAIEQVYPASAPRRQGRMCLQSRHQGSQDPRIVQTGHQGLL